MNWIKVEAAMPHAYTAVLGAIEESGGRQAVRMVLWTGREWEYQTGGTPVHRYGHLVTHWMPLPSPPLANH
jgi:uncharacterized protein DUF551